MVVGGIRDTEYGVWSMECLTWNLDAGWRIIYFQENSTHILFTVHYSLYMDMNDTYVVVRQKGKKSIKQVF